LNPDYKDGQCYLAKTLFFYKQEAEGYKHMDKCIDLDGAFATFAIRPYTKPDKSLRQFERYA